MKEIVFEKDRIAALIIQLGMNPNSFGRKIDRPSHLVQQWLDGKCVPSTRSIERMCNSFSVSPTYFFVEKNVRVHEGVM